jgi:hypothetical protein
VATSGFYGRLSDAQSKRNKSLIEVLVQWLFARWRSDPLTTASIPRLVDDTVEKVLETMDETRVDADAFLKEALEAEGKRFPKDVSPARDGSYPRKNILPEDVWERPVSEYRNARNNGDSHQEAMLKTLARVRQLADADVRMANRERAARVYEAASPQGVIGYRRIIHPELSRTGTCGLCLVAADRLYSTKELYPLHDNCKCETLPVTNTSDPGLKLNRDDLDYIYSVAGGNTASKLSNTRISEYVSGERGPTLARRVEKSKSGLTPNDEKYSLSGEDAERASYVHSPREELIDAQDELAALRRKRSKPRRIRTSVLEDRIAYWERQARKYSA